jgi:hypothetical protein
MPSTKTVLVALAASAALAMGGQPVAHAEPPQPLPMPITGLQAPGLPAMESLAPAIQQAATDPSNATSMLMAAAAAFAGNSAPPDSKNMAAAVNQFAADPQVAHVPAVGAVPGAEAHLPQGTDPANAVGPAQDVPAEALAAVAPGGGDAVPGPGPAPAPAPPPLSATTTQDFMYPSISNGCLADGGNVLATAISVAGPATIPSPGPTAGQTAYVFTAIGTPGPGAEQKLPLNVTWVNLTTGKSGGATLKPQADINPDGPTTLTAIVDTGSGSIMSTIFGQVTTTEKQCQFMPTIGSTVVP